MKQLVSARYPEQVLIVGKAERYSVDSHPHIDPGPLYRKHELVWTYPSVIGRRFTCDGLIERFMIHFYIMEAPS